MECVVMCGTIQGKPDAEEKKMTVLEYHLGQQKMQTKTMRKLKLENDQKSKLTNPCHSCQFTSEE